MKKILAGMTAAATGIGSALADGPVQGGVAMLPARSALAEEVHVFHNWILMPVITAISVLVLALLLWIIVRYNSKANPTAQKFSHNTLIEIVWTAIPILILLGIALPSFDLLYKEEIVPDGKQVVAEADGATTEFVFANAFGEHRRVTRPEHVQVLISSADGDRRLQRRADYKLAGLGKDEVRVTLNEAPAAGERVIIRGGRSLVGVGKIFDLYGEDRREIALAPTMTLKVTGFQWGWIYSYPDFGDFEFSANPLSEEEAPPGLFRFDTDNHVIVPLGETIRVTTTARDVIHSWAMPNFAIKVDAVPGRINETWFNANKEGLYYGQCSEICGVKHSFMPIAIEVVSRPKFEAWVDSQRAQAGLEPMFDSSAVKLAQASGE